MPDQEMIQLLRVVARQEAGGAPVINQSVAAEGVSRGYVINWRGGYVRTRLGKAYLRSANDA